MNILLVNNHTLHMPKLMIGLAGHEVEVVKYTPGVQFNQTGKDLIILSGGGGEGMEANDYHTDGELWYKDELELIMSTKLPVLGICMGFQLISSAYGQKVQRLNKDINQQMTLHVSRAGQKQFNRQFISQFEYHEWHVTGASKELEVLADSDVGIEMIKHQKRPILATQFHPEIPGGSLSLDNLIKKAVLA